MDSVRFLAVSCLSKCNALCARCSTVCITQVLSRRERRGRRGNGEMCVILIFYWWKKAGKRERRRGRRKIKRDIFSTFPPTLKLYGSPTIVPLLATYRDLPSNMNCLKHAGARAHARRDREKRMYLNEEWSVFSPYWLNSNLVLRSYLTNTHARIQHASAVK